MKRILICSTVVLTLLACGTSDPFEIQEPQATSIRLSEESIEIDTGAHTTVEADVLDADGGVIDDASVSWLSDDPQIATVNDMGLLTGRTAGQTDIHAVFGVLTAAALVVVADTSAREEPDTPPDTTTAPAQAECAQPAASWIWCDDFEDARFDAYFEYNEANGSFTRRDGVGLEGSHGMSAAWSAGQVSAGSLHLAVGRSPDGYRHSVGPQDRDFTRLFWRVYVRYQDGWIGGGGAKLSRAFVFHSPDNWGQAMIAHLWSSGEGGHFLAIDPASGTDEAGTPQTTTYNDFENLRWLGLVRSTTPIFDNDHVGEWYCVEAEVSLNNPSASDGAFRLWIDERLEAEGTDLNWVGTYDEYGINAVFLENYWNGGSPTAQERYFDNFVVSTERIGCL